MADVDAMNTTPEQLGEFPALSRFGGLQEFLSGKTKAATTEEGRDETENENENLYKDEESYLDSIPDHDEDVDDSEEEDGDVSSEDEE